VSELGKLFCESAKSTLVDTNVSTDGFPHNCGCRAFLKGKGENKTYLPALSIPLVINKKETEVPFNRLPAHMCVRQQRFPFWYCCSTTAHFPPVLDANMCTSQPRHRNRDVVDETMLSFSDLPGMSEGLPDGHDLQPIVQVLASQFLQVYNAQQGTGKPTSSTALTIPTTTPAAATPPPPKPEPLLVQAMRDISINNRSSPSPNKSCRHTRLRNGNGNGNTKTALKTTRGTGSLDRPVIACPMYKKDPNRYHSCAYTITLTSTRAARQHVIIDHPVPIYCAMCHSHFPTLQLRDEHERARTCTVLERVKGEGEEDPTIEGVTGDQREKLLRLDASGKGPRRIYEDEEESWFRTWDVLFPGVKRPKTAYLSSPGEQEILALRRFWKKAGPAVVKRLLGEETDGATLRAVQASVLEKMIKQAGL
jgi:hypothetical protein